MTMPRGGLEWLEGTFVTSGHRSVSFRIYADAKELDKLKLAMVSLKKSMKGADEDYGREHDLDLFHISEVDDFNMDAM